MISSEKYTFWKVVKLTYVVFKFQNSNLATNTVRWLFSLRRQVHFIFEKMSARYTSRNNLLVFLSRKSDVP